jgi:glycosyltransferase involved in cell wall biosynthesis
VNPAAETKDRPEVSIILESYNHTEGSSLDRLAISLRAALRTASKYGAAEVLLADSSADPELPAMLVDDLSEVRRVDATGHPYDQAKEIAASQAQGDYILFLDGDVIPDHDDWAAAHVYVLRNGAVATTGFTRYEGGYFQQLCTVMDFGFLLPVEDRDARCYTSNNAGFRAETLREFPIPKGPLRCHCYEHADLLRRRGTPMRLVPAATGKHEKQPFWDERFRRGFDQVGACWTNKSLPEARLLKLGPLAAPLFYARDVLLDWRNILRSRRDLGFGPLKVAAALVLMPFLRLPDLVGIVRALVTPPRARVAAPATRTDPSP